jgi:hypothetical protein
MDELRQPIVIPADAYQRRIFGFIGERMLPGFSTTIKSNAKPK